MATSSAPVSLEPTPSTTLWGIVLLEHLDEFATSAWCLVADGKLVDDRFSRTLAKLDTIPKHGRRMPSRADMNWARLPLRFPPHDCGE
jgi:hypothetical protein